MKTLLNMVAAAVLGCTTSLAWSATPAKAAPAAVKPAHQAAANQLLAAQSEVRFSAKQMGVAMPGLFQKIAGSLQWDAKQPAASHIRLEIPLASASVGDAAMDAELLKPEWFGAKQFPKAVFESRSVRPLGGNRYEVQGQLSIKGVSLPVKTVASVAAQGATSTATGQLDMARLAYKIGLGAWGDTSVVADAVQVQYRIQFKTNP